MQVALELPAVVSGVLVVLVGGAVTTPPWLHPACAGLICFTHAATITASQLTAVAVQLNGLCSCTTHCVLQHSLGALSVYLPACGVVVPGHVGHVCAACAAIHVSGRKVVGMLAGLVASEV